MAMATARWHVHVRSTIHTITSLNASNLVGERERGNGEQSSRGVGRVGTMAAVNSRDKNRLEKRSSRRAWCTFGRHFLSSASARCAVGHVRLRWRRRRRLVAVGENFLFSSLAWQLGRRKGVFYLRQIASNQALPALGISHPTCCYWRRLIGKGSRAVVVNSNMSSWKYSAREGPGSRLLSPKQVVVNSKGKGPVKFAASIDARQYNITINFTATQQDAKGNSVGNHEALHCKFLKLL